MSSMLRFLQARHGTTPLRFHYSQTQDLSNELLTTLLATQPFFSLHQIHQMHQIAISAVFAPFFALSGEGVLPALHSMFATGLVSRHTLESRIFEAPSILRPKSRSLRNLWGSKVLAKSV